MGEKEEGREGRVGVLAIAYHKMGVELGYLGRY